MGESQTSIEARWADAGRCREELGELGAELRGTAERVVEVAGDTGGREGWRRLEVCGLTGTPRSPAGWVRRGRVLGLVRGRTVLHSAEQGLSEEGGEIVGFVAGGGELASGGGQVQAGEDGGETVG